MTDRVRVSRVCDGEFLQKQCPSAGLGPPLVTTCRVCQSACPPTQFRTRRPHFPSPPPLLSANICPPLLPLPTTPSTSTCVCICIYICISPCLSLAPFQSSLALPNLLLLAGANSAGPCQGKATQLKTTTTTVGLPYLSLPPRHLHLDGYLQSSVLCTPSCFEYPHPLARVATRSGRHSACASPHSLWRRPRSQLSSSRPFVPSSTASARVDPLQSQTIGHRGAAACVVTLLL